MLRNGSSTTTTSSSSSRQSVTIPINWMLQENVNDIPIHTNQKYPFPCQPPIVPIQNPTGLYQLEFVKGGKEYRQDTNAFTNTTTITAAAIWPQQWGKQDDQDHRNNDSPP